MTEIALQRARLDLQVQNAQHQWAVRESVLVCVRHGDHVGVGEACPLPGYSVESSAAVADWLERFSAQQLDDSLQQSEPQALLAALSPKLKGAPPSARFAIETAALDVLGQRLGLPLWRLLRRVAELSDPVRVEAPRCSLIALEQPNVEAAFDALLAAGVRTFKAKIGTDLPREIAQLRALRLRTRAPWELRLDANRSFAAENWLTALELLAPLQPQFIEEPCAPEHLGAPRSLPIPLAFDETLTDPRDLVFAHLDSWLHSAAVRALVLKPMLIGSVTQSLGWAERAAALGLDAIVSHVFDGAVAALVYRHWSLAVGSQTLASGLGAHAGLGLWSQLGSEHWGAPGLGWVFSTAVTVPAAPPKAYQP